MQEHERALGGWQAEWPTFPALALVTSGALAAIADIAQGLEVDGERMRANLDRTHGLIMAEAVSLALAAKLGKHEAHKLVEEASRKALAAKRHLQDVLARGRSGETRPQRRRDRQAVRTHELPRRRADLHRPHRRLAAEARAGKR